MPLSNPDGTLITCTGIVSAITGVVVTILKLKASKPEMEPEKHIELAASVGEIVKSHYDIIRKLALLEQRLLIDADVLKDVREHFQLDHKRIRELELWRAQYMKKTKDYPTGEEPD